MKKILLLFVVAVATLTSCSNDESNNIDALKLESVISTTNKNNEQRVAYSLLNPDEKFSLWNNQFNELLDENSLNTNQKDLIRELQKNVKVSFFSEEVSDEKEYFKNIFVPNYLVKLQLEFSNESINEIFYSLKPSRITPILINNPGVTKGCDCNQGSLFGGCSGNCEEKTCKGSSTGCGFLWAWECNGVCKLTDL